MGEDIYKEDMSQMIYHKRPPKKTKKIRKKEAAMKVRHLSTLISEIDSDLLTLDQTVVPSRKNNKLTTKEKVLMQKLDKEWARRDKVFSAHLRGIRLSTIAKKLHITRACVWKDITAKQWEMRRLQSVDSLSTLKYKYEELLKHEWEAYRDAEEHGAKIEHAKVIQSLLKDFARLEGFDFKEGPKSLNIFGNQQAIMVNGQKPVDKMSEEEIDAELKREARKLKTITSS